MKHFYKFLLSTIPVFSLSISTLNAQQAVTGIVTDYNSYWSSSATSVNSIKPANSHNMLAFTYNGTQYSTGVNDLALTTHHETFVAGDFWALPVDVLSNSLTSNTKVGLGEMYDGVHAGASNPAPARDINRYLTDGVKGLNIGTCIANLPAGTLTFFISNIRPQNIGDGIPDIIVTQVADPSGTNDRYSFTDVGGNVIGQTKEIIFNNITPVGNWTADFYEAATNPMTLTAGFTNTDRQMRLWAADLSDFGITAANYQSISKFKINLAGNSDVAFVAYNNKTFNIGSLILPVTLVDFSAKTTSKGTALTWKTETEKNSSMFVIERSADNKNFNAIDTVNASGTTNETRNYSSLDARPNSGMNYYRLKMVDADGKSEYSKTVQVRTEGKSFTVSVYPNPATDQITISLPATAKVLRIFDNLGRLKQQVNAASSGSTQQLSLAGWTKGTYYLVAEGDNAKQAQTFVVR